nr:MAG TPA: hypothetical protein [Caudoviricetes sp.]
MAGWGNLPSLFLKIFSRFFRFPIIVQQFRGIIRSSGSND